MHWILLIIKFLASFIAISATLLYAGNYINSYKEATALFATKDSKNTLSDAAQYRVKLGIIMAITWSIVIVL